MLPATVAYVLAYARHEPRRLRGRHPGRAAPPGQHRSTTTAVSAAPSRSSAFALAFALACLAGLPPGLLGLFAKVVVFQAPVEQGTGWLAVVMAVNVVIGLYYYLAWAASLYGRAGGDGAPALRPPSYRISWSDGTAIGITLGSGAGVLRRAADDPRGTELALCRPATNGVDISST